MAGKATRILNYCNTQPNPCKCLNTCIEPMLVPKTKVEKFLIDNNTLSGAPFSVCNYGNAFTGVETFAGEGDGRIGIPVNSNMYFRFASTTKVLGMIILGAALEDGYIESLDDPIGNYIDAFTGEGTYINPTSVSSEAGFDQFGSPNYSCTTSTFLLNTITIRHLVNMTAGFGYSFIGSGTLRDLLNSMPDPSPDISTCNRNTFIAWLQLIEANEQLYGYGYADNIDSYYQSAPSSNFSNTFTSSILNRITKIPFLFLPGTQYLYDISPTIMGAVVGAALQKAGRNITSVQYLQSRILSPLNISSFWFNCGSSQPPTDAQTNITDAFFVRNDTFIGTDKKLYLGNRSGDGSSTEFNKLYRCSDPNVRGDGFTNQTNNTFFQNVVGISGGDYLAGGYDWSGCGTLPDFCKLLKFLILKGKNTQGQQVLKSQTIEWILVPKVPENQELWLFGDDTYNFSYPSSTWCGAFNKFMSNQPSLPFPCGPNTYAKQSYFGLDYFFDTETGNYMISGTQSPGCSWYTQQSYNTVYPYGSSHDPDYEPDELSLWRLTTME